MDAIRFLEERKRMFKSGEPVPGLNIDINYDSEKVVKIVEEWSTTHPKKTRQDVFLEQWPGTRTRYGEITIKPCELIAEFREANGDCARHRINCANCCKEFWTQEVE